MNQPWVYMCPYILNPPPTSLPIPSLRVVPVHQLWVPCFMHWTWTGYLFHIWKYTCFNAILSNHPTLTFSYRVQKSVLYVCVSFAVLHIGSLLPSFKIPYTGPCFKVIFILGSFSSVAQSCPTLCDPMNCRPPGSSAMEFSRDTDIKNRLLDSVGEGKGGMIWDNSIETGILPSVK